MGQQHVAAGVRARWHDLPERVRSGMDDLLGSPVVDAVNQAGGFSPGLAARVRCAADGSRVFVKAVGTPLNHDSPGIHRAEAEVTRQLPADAPVPRPRGTYGDGHPLVADVAPGVVTAFVAGMAGFFAEVSHRPAPPGLPTLRAFQGAQHASTLAWRRRRLGRP